MKIKFGELARGVVKCATNAFLCLTVAAQFA